ncbi:MAG: aminopeptidase P family N-terminal domain-containing protein, partial [Gammaproteobacteria bacterium]|nr:aminopeptidase P family N-terminal domain-containing protein [Gammaproteobacteria bacterium]
MPIHFPRKEFDARIHAAQAAMRERGFDGMLLFAPESHYYLSGYDTFGYALFQCMVLPAEG